MSAPRPAGVERRVSTSCAMATMLAAVFTLETKSVLCLSLRSW
jgi:hypothetical protein